MAGLGPAILATFLPWRNSSGEKLAPVADQPHENSHPDRHRKGHQRAMLDLIGQPPHRVVSVPGAELERFVAVLGPEPGCLAAEFRRFIAHRTGTVAKP